MKKVIAIIAILLIASVAIAQDPWIFSTGERTTSSLVKTGPGNLHGIIIATDGSNSVTLDIYNNTVASGSKLIPTTVITSSTALMDTWRQIDFKTPVHFSNGLYVGATSSGTFKYSVFYK